MLVSDPPVLVSLLAVASLLHIIGAAFWSFSHWKQFGERDVAHLVGSTLVFLFAFLILSLLGDEGVFYFFIYLLTGNEGV